MPAPVEIIQLEAHDDVVSVRDRLSFVEAHRVLLVWPKDGRILTRELDLVLLQREIKRQARRLALVTDDLDVIDNARDLNISTFPTVEASQHRRWRRGRAKVFTDRADKPERDPDPEDLQAAASRIKSVPTPAQLTLRRTFTILGLGLALLLVAGLAYLFLPSATIALTPAYDHMDITIRITTDPAAADVDLDNGVIPSVPLRVELEETATVETTGTAETGPTLARGTVVFTNRTAETYTIPVGTVVRTGADPVIGFRTLEAVNIAGESGAIAIVPVEALPDFAGPVGNVAAYTLNAIDGPLADVLSVQNLDAMTGGGVPTERVVAQADHDRLLAAARQALQLNALTRLEAMLGDGQTLIPESIRIAEERPEWTVFSAPVGEPVGRVTVTMRAVVAAVAVDERLINQASFAGLAQRIPPGQVVVPESMTFSRGEIESMGEAGQITFLANVSGNVIHALDVGAMQQRLAGRSINEVLAYLYEEAPLEPGTAPTISVWPEVFGRMPTLPERITITLRETP